MFLTAPPLALCIYLAIAVLVAWKHPLVRAVRARLVRRVGRRGRGVHRPTSAKGVACPRAPALDKNGTKRCAALRPHCDCVLASDRLLFPLWLLMQLWPVTRLLLTITAVGVVASAQLAGRYSFIPKPSPVDMSGAMCSADASVAAMCSSPASLTCVANASVPRSELVAATESHVAACGPWWANASQPGDSDPTPPGQPAAASPPRKRLVWWACVVVKAAICLAAEACCGWPIVYSTVWALIVLHDSVWNERYRIGLELRNVDDEAPGPDEHAAGAASGAAEAGAGGDRPEPAGADGAGAPARHGVAPQAATHGANAVPHRHGVGMVA